MKKIKELGNSILLCVLELLVGVLLLINPVSFTSGILILGGVIIIILGIADVIKYFRTEAKEAAKSQTLMKGLLLILGGAFCAIRTKWFLATFPVLTILFGIGILITGVGKVQLTVDMLRQKNKMWYWPAINAVISIVCAIIVLRSPFKSTMVLWVFTGISMIVEGFLDIVTMVAGKRNEPVDEPVE